MVCLNITNKKEINNFLILDLDSDIKNLDDAEYARLLTLSQAQRIEEVIII